MIRKKYDFGNLHISFGTSAVWGIELSIASFDWSVVMHLLNVYIVFEWYEDRELQP